MSIFNEENGIKYCFVKTDRFKTTAISVSFFTPLKKENAAANALLCALMSSGTEKYPDAYSFNRRLASLYGAAVSGIAVKSGDMQEIRLSFTVNDDRYSMDGESISADAGELICDMIFGRFFSKSSYPSDAVAREKRLLCESIAAEKNDKRQYARRRCEEIMCAEEAFGLSPDGTVEDVQALTDGDIAKAAERLIKTALVSVIAVGSEEPVCFKERFEKCMTAAKRDYAPIMCDTVRAAETVKEVEEKFPVKQGKLVMGFRSPQGGDDSETLAVMIMSDIFGGGPYSKLFCNVREKMSLCYYCSARAVRRKGLIFVESGVEKDNIAAAKKAIAAQFDDIKNGNFTEKELEFSKLAIGDMLRSVESDQPALCNYYAARARDKSFPDIEKTRLAIAALTAEDIRHTAESFSLDTVYVLCPDGTAKEDDGE